MAENHESQISEASASHYPLEGQILMTYRSHISLYFLKVIISFDNTLLEPKPLGLGALLDVQQLHNDRQQLLKSVR